MTRVVRCLTWGVAAVLGLAATAGAQYERTNPVVKSNSSMETAKIADTIVNTCANIRNRELVWINGGTRDQKLLEDIAIEIRNLGAHPFITLGSDRLTRKMFTDVPARFDNQEPTFALELADLVNAMITVDFNEKPDLLADVPASRLTTHHQAFEPFMTRLLERGVLQVNLGNGLFPTDARARQFGLKKSELSRIFWKGVNTDYRQLQQTGATIQNIFANGSQCRITAPNGTDLKMKIDRREVFVSDGVISDEDRYSKGPACQVWLPAGEVYLVPRPGTVTGTFVADNFFFEGRHIPALKLVFNNGKMTSMTAKGDITKLKQRYEAAPVKGRDVFAALDIGINPDVITPNKGKMVTWMSAGTITIGVGNNTWAGGENNTPFDLFAHLTTGTLKVDTKTVVETGKLIVK